MTIASQLHSLPSSDPVQSLPTTSMPLASRVAVRSIPSKLTRSISTASSKDRSSQTCLLPDGRSLGYAEYGSPAGTPVFFFHGMPDSRIAIRTTDEIAKRLNIRFIGIDRPGIGLSTFYPNRKVTDWPSDVQLLIDHLNIDRYRILSLSGGTGYALACAKMLPKEKLQAAGVVAGIGPWEAGTKGMSIANRIGLNLWAYAPTRPLMRAIQNRIVVPAAQDPDHTKIEEIFRSGLKYFKERDRQEFEKPEEFKLVCDIYREVARQGVDGHVEEARLVTRYWGFDLEEVQYDKIKFWVGDEDENTPFEHAEYMLKRLPTAQLKVYPGVSHFTIWNHVEEMLSELLEIE